jgi:hypothetical protein
MSSILGLMSTKDLASSFSETARREVFYRFPEGRFPLMGLLSLLDSEETDKTKFGWWEHREPQYYTTTAANPFSTAAGVAQSDGFSTVVGTPMRVTVANTDKFRVRDVIWIKDIPQATTATKLLQIRGIITEIVSATVLEFRPVEAVADIEVTISAGKHVFAIGSAAAEGDRSRTGSTTLPIEIENYTQIHRTSFNFTRNALKAGLRWDRTGIYKHKAKENMLRHMELLEKAALFGTRGTSNVTNDNGDTTPERTSGGIRWFLEQYEKNSTYNYRDGGSDITFSDWTTEEEKRIIQPTSGTMTAAQFETLNERIFKYNGNSSNEKLVLCGNKFIKAFQQYVKLDHSVQTGLNPKEEVYGMKIFRWTTPWGDLIFKSHPLFNQSLGLQASAFVLDVGSMKYVHAEDADTQCLKNRQNNDEDGRKDEWITECGIELHYPERHFFIDNLTTITAS